MQNFEHQSADGDTELASMNFGIPTKKIKCQLSDDLNNFSSSMKRSNDHVLLLLLALMMMVTLVAASRHGVVHDQPQERQDSVIALLFILCNSTAFVSSLAGVIYPLHEFPFKPWPQITVSMLFGPYTLLVFKISPNQALPQLGLSIPILLIPAAGKLYDFVWGKSFSGSGDTFPA
ncbi:Hypothetical predicted protein [Olea europaea subsp. europaea]|uniref:Uncharacterized protein n=1 Tax=Olea europaea subsp. europaea TaxID=158383 RepID=A0A8S0RF64_OLEEU|nr:Hypothetical predicted protein [Olea europaea subsp. europaea]